VIIWSSIQAFKNIANGVDQTANEKQLITD